MLAGSALSRSSAQAARRRGCPGWPVAQQWLPPLQPNKQAAYCLCWCVSHSRSRGSRRQISGCLAQGHLPCGVKSVRHFRPGTACLLLHLVLWSLPGALQQHRPRVKIHPVCPDTVFRSSPPRAALSLSRRKRCAPCWFGLPLWRFPSPPRYLGLLLQGPALCAILPHPLHMMPYYHGTHECTSSLDPHYCSRPQRDEGPAPGGDGRRQDRLCPQCFAQEGDRQPEDPPFLLQRQRCSLETRPGVDGSGRPAWDLKSNASSMKGTWLCACGSPSSGGSHIS